MTRFSARALSALLLSVSAPAMAQTRAPAQSIPVARALGPVVARSTQTFGRIAPVLASGGSVFVNDGLSRQLWMLDSSLKTGRIVLDSASGTGRMNWYGQFNSVSGLRRFKTDSLMFTPVGGASEALIFGNEGKVVRVAAMPVDVVPCVFADMDAAGWLVCQAPLPLVRGAPVKVGDSTVTMSRADSAVLVGVHFRTWDADTIARLQVAPRVSRTAVTGTLTRGTTIGAVHPLVDAWAMFHDGTVAVARALDYHLDVINTQGQVTRGPKAPYAWRPLNDAEKDRLVDSMRVADSINLKRLDSIGTAIGTPPPLTLRQGPTRLPRDEWPSFYPPFAAASALVQPIRMSTDLNDRIWVAERPAVGLDSTQVYGIFDKKGQFLERVRIPSSQTLLGFGPDNTVYLSTAEAGRTTLLRARFK